ncbi:MAG: serine/threonine-protein kinase, partial [Thermoanaerobaculia bacterium]
MSATESAAERRARLFSELCELGEVDRRAALARLAEEDPALAADVARMLAFDHESHGPIEGLRDEVAGAAERQLLAGAPAEPPPPERLGAWLLGEKLGAGGMGEVWAAERVEGGFTQRAAVKLVRSGMASREIVARFAVERQLLARLDHPAIATLLDGGVAPDGRPWFAMERVDGLSITNFADGRGLDLEGRLRLLLAVADAVDFAHRSLVIHRDLKPSNILVTPSGAPKLLDFGLAKLLEPGFEAGIDPNVTKTEFRALTPAYAAPEQILGEPVTTATDVYSLGVILYELLTGELPHRRRMSSATTLAADVAHETLERPSSRLRRLESGKAHGALRSRRIHPDLDTIVLKALARERERRYPSVAAFAADLVAYLERRPISARPDTLRYRLSKFVRRHRVAVAAGVVVFAALILALSVSIRQTWRANAAAEAARLEARRAERVKGFLVSVFEQADPNRARGAEMPARQILAEGASRLESELRDEPEVRAELYDAVARIQGSLGLLDEGLASAERASAERARLFGPRSREHAQSLVTVGKALLAQGRVEEAGKRFEEAVLHFGSDGDAGSVDRAAAFSGRAEVKMMTGDLAGSLADERHAYEICAAALGETDARTLEHLSNIAVLQTEAGTFAEAARIFRQILSVLEPAEGGDSPKVLDVTLNLATALDSAGESAEALPLFERVVAGRRRIYGPQHPALAEGLVVTSLRLSRAGRSDEALAALAEARAIYQPLDHPELGSVENYTGLALADLGRFAEAEHAFERAAARFANDGGVRSALAVTALSNEAHAVSEQGRVVEAEAMFARAVATLRALQEFDNPRLLRARFNWGATLRKLGRFSEARAVLEAAMALARLKLDAGHLRIAEGEVELARLDLAEGGVGAADRARERIAAAETIVATKTPSPS